MKRTAILLPLLVLAAGFQEEPKRETAIAKKDVLKIEYDLDGVFEPGVRIVVQPKFEGWQGELTVAKVAAHGARVKKGEVLVEFEKGKWKEAIDAAELEVDAARTNLVRAEEDQRLNEVGEALTLDKTEREAREAGDRLKYFTEVEMALELKELDERMAMFQDYLSDQQEELEQLEKMYKSEELTNATADIVVKRARRNLERGRKQIEFVKVRLERIKTHDQPLALEQAKQAARDAAQALDVAKKAAPHARKDKEVAVARARQAQVQQEENLAKLKRDEAQFSAAASEDGTVWYGQFENGGWAGVEEALKNLKPGEKAAAGQPILTLVPDRLAVKTALAEGQIGDFVPGCAVTVGAAAFSDLSLKGKAGAPVLIGARQGESFPLRIELETGDPRIVPGLKAKVHVVVAEIKDALVIPAAAVRAEGGKKTVRVVAKDKTVAVREVTVGRAGGDLIEIKTGLVEGEEVLISEAGEAPTK